MRRPLIRASVPAVAALAAIMVAGVLSPAGASPAADDPVLQAVKPSAVAGNSHTVRLITGDTVVVTQRGGQRHATFYPDSDNPSASAQILQHGKDITVVPLEARPLLDAGVLDPRLFEVGDLIDQGYADGAALPLIVQGYDAKAAAPTGAEQTRRLPGIRAVAARVKPGKAQRFWAGLRSGKDGATARKLADGTRKVWLDGKVTALLDRSVPQIGAPTAWAAGYDGAGVKVAVLDTGVDATHPDLAGRLGEVRNFSTSADAVDRHGHGTHVASTVGGSGAASDGKNKGVAPGAKLLVGKVLGDNGSGTDSGVIAGMEWAARSGAKVVSMSLGKASPDNGSDPTSLAANALTAETGALFVIAAGNTGPDATTIGSPGSADAALTVAAVDRQDKIASFSSRGPRAGDNMLKPDIAAPGVNIVAARAAGTSMGSPVNEHYTAASGTSMATPHVAGAAAILSQQHPDWSAADIKGALMSSAKVLPDGAFAEGSGRVDLPSALSATVSATNASFGRYAQGTTADPVTRTVTFHNLGDEAVTLGLTTAFSRDGDGPEIPGALSLGSDSITLPAGDSQQVAVTVDPDVAATGGTYTGTISATGGGVTAHATVALARDLPTYKLDFRPTMPDGSAPMAISAHYYDLRSNKPPVKLSTRPDGTGSAQVRAGRYSVSGHLFGKDGSSVTFMVPDVTVTDRGVTVAVDGRKAALIKAKAPQPTEAAGVSVVVTRQSAEQSIGVADILAAGPGAQYLMPSEPAQDGEITSTVTHALRSRPVSALAELPTGKRELTTQSIHGTLRFDGNRTLTVVDAKTGSVADLGAHDVTGKLALIRTGTEDLNTVVRRLVSAGASGVMFVGASDTLKALGVQKTGIPGFSVPKSEGDAVAAAAADQTVRIRLTGERTSSYSYQLVAGRKGAISADQTYTAQQSEFAEVRLQQYSPAPNSDTELYSQAAWAGQSTVTGWATGLAGETHLGSTQRAYLQAADTIWSRSMLISGWLSAQTTDSTPVRYQPGERTTQHWFRPVLHSATSASNTDPATGSQPYRTKDDMVVAIPKYADGRSGFTEYGGRNADGDYSQFRAYRNGTLIGSGPHAWVVIKGVAPEPSRYRFELDTKRSNMWWSVSTEQHTAWTFSSEHVPGEERKQLPLLQADYDLADVDLRSGVTGGEDHELEVAFRDPDGSRAALVEASVDVSYDDGATWRTLPAAVDGSAVTTMVHAPEGAKGISLRIHGENSAGSTIDQTVMHAVHVR
ncbi:S8 family serine peptidase [Streptomyces sp. YC504]|uniref:S8 family serine peptidase n=1 Tax=Streptomyces mesophilus TaxID=1775132 RepID=A0A6G4X9E1_9ACTN|nr:S8 family serine peptidase [Streptomyces mesophilus]NGO74135.1 S8 family serine peptidase [Streptomyces mesophilus]